MGMAYFLADALALELSNRRRWGGEGGGWCIRIAYRSKREVKKKRREEKEREKPWIQVAVSSCD